MIEIDIDRLVGNDVNHKKTVIADLEGVFENEIKRSQMPGQGVVYEVDAFKPVPSGTIGGLFFGITRIHPGRVGDEYFMTRGHFHAKPDRSEFYWGIGGEGVLILMDCNRRVKTENIFPGSVHYIPAYTAHRVANIGNGILSFGACWPADAGYDYEEIKENGFAASLMCINGTPKLKTKG